MNKPSGFVFGMGITARFEASGRRRKSRKRRMMMRV